MNRTCEKINRKSINNNLMTSVIGHITLSCTRKYSLNERKLKQNTRLQQDLCSRFSRQYFFKSLTLMQNIYYRYRKQHVWPIIMIKVHTRYVIQLRDFLKRKALCFTFLCKFASFIISGAVKKTTNITVVYIIN